MKYYRTGDRFFYNMKYLKKDWPSYFNEDTGTTLEFMSLKSGKVTFIATDKNGHSDMTDKGTTSLKVLNKRIEKYGLQFTDF